MPKPALNGEKNLLQALKLFLEGLRRTPNPFKRI